MFADHHAEVGQHLFSDERVQWAQEVTQPHPQLGWVRWQTICVIRDDKPVKFRKLLGPESMFPDATRAINFVSLGEYSAGEAAEILEALRAGKPEPEEPRDLIALWRRQNEELAALRANRSVFGPSVTIQRNYA
jgi:hypothetical protein